MSKKYVGILNKKEIEKRSESNRMETFVATFLMCLGYSMGFIFVLIGKYHIASLVLIPALFSSGCLLMCFNEKRYWDTKQTILYVGGKLK